LRGGTIFFDVRQVTHFTSFTLPIRPLLPPLEFFGCFLSIVYETELKGKSSPPVGVVGIRFFFQTLFSLGSFHISSSVCKVLNPLSPKQPRRPILFSLRVLGFPICSSRLRISLFEREDPCFSQSVHGRNACLLPPPTTLSRNS